MSGDLLTTQQVAERLQTSKRYVDDQLRSKRLRGFKIGDGPRARWRIHESDLKAFLEARSNVRPVQKKRLA